MKATTLVAAVLSALFLVLAALTIWATGKSQDRAACYRMAQAVEDCEQPGTVETLIRQMLTPNDQAHRGGAA